MKNFTIPCHTILKELVIEPQMEEKKSVIKFWRGWGWGFGSGVYSSTFLGFSFVEFWS